MAHAKTSVELLGGDFASSVIQFSYVLFVDGNIPHEDSAVDGASCANAALGIKNTKNIIADNIKTFLFMRGLIIC